MARAAVLHSADVCGVGEGHQAAESGVDAVLIDRSLDVPTMARQLRPVASGGVQRYTLAVRGAEIDGKAVLRLEDEALAVISHFQGGPPPVTS